jgi:hypothetical protein
MCHGPEFQSSIWTRPAPGKFTPRKYNKKPAPPWVAGKRHFSGIFLTTWDYLLEWGETLIPSK